MTRLKLGSKSVISVTLAVLLLLSGLAWQRAAAQVAPRPADLPPAQPAALSSTLSYYFISGNTFTPALGSSSYARQVNGCVNQTPAVGRLSAPVHLPQASQVVSITLFTMIRSRPRPRLARLILAPTTGKAMRRTSSACRPTATRESWVISITKI